MYLCVYVCFLCLFVVFYSGQCGGDVEKWIQFENKQRVKGSAGFRRAMVSYGTSMVLFGMVWHKYGLITYNVAGQYSMV